MELAERVDEHLRDGLLPLVQCGDRGVREVGDGIAVTAVGRGGPEFNCAAVFAVPADPDAALRWALDLLGATGRPYAVQVPTDLRPALAASLARHRLELVATLPGMALAPLPEPPPPPAGLRVVPVTDEAELAAHAAAVADGFGAPSAAAVAEVLPPALLDDARVTMLDGYVDGTAEPVATAVSVVIGGVGGVFAVTVADRMRRRGLGAALTWAAVATGIRGGADVAALQATPMGLPVYERMGFRTVRTYERYGPR